MTTSQGNAAPAAGPVLARHLFLKGYRSRVMAALMNYPIEPGNNAEPDFLAGWDAAAVRAENLTAMRESDPQEFQRHFGKAPTNRGICDVHARLASEEAWGAL